MKHDEAWDLDVCDDSFTALHSRMSHRLDSRIQKGYSLRDHNLV